MKKIDHTVTQKELTNILNCVDAIGSAIDSYKKNVASIDPHGVFNNDYISAKEKGFRETLNGVTTTRYESILSSLDKIEECEAVNEVILDITDPVYQAAVGVINAMGNALDSATASQLVMNLRGNVRAEQSLFDMFDAKCIVYDDKNKKYAKSVKAITNDISLAIANIGNGSTGNTPGMVNLPALFKIQAKAIELADVMGFEVDIKNPFSDDLRAEYMAERLGVPMV